MPSLHAQVCWACLTCLTVENSVGKSAAKRCMGQDEGHCSLDLMFLYMLSGRQGAVVASINGEMVGMLASSPCTPELLDSWSAQYRLDHSLPCSSLQDHQHHAQVSACVINPVFATQAGALLAGVFQRSQAMLVTRGDGCWHWCTHVPTAPCCSCARRTMQ